MAELVLGPNRNQINANGNHCVDSLPSALLTVNAMDVISEIIGPKESSV